MKIKMKKKLLNMSSREIDQHRNWLLLNLKYINDNSKKRIANSHASFALWNFVFHPSTMVNVYHLLSNIDIVDIKDEDDKLFIKALKYTFEESKYRIFLDNKFLRRSYNQAMRHLVEILKTNIDTIKQVEANENITEESQ